MIDITEIRNRIQLIIGACATLRLLPPTEELPSCSINSVRNIMGQVVRVSNLLDIDLHAACCNKMKLNERKYPVGMCKEEVRKWSA